MFSPLDLEKARIIRVGQALGCSLKEIGAFINQRAFDGQEEDVVIAFLAEQRGRLAGQISELQRLVGFVDAKIAWLRDPNAGPSPPYPV